MQGNKIKQKRIHGVNGNKMECKERKINKM